MPQLANGYFLFAALMNNANEKPTNGGKKEREKGTTREKRDATALTVCVMLSGTWWRKYFKYLSYVHIIGSYCTRHESPTPPTRWRAGVFPSRASCCQTLMTGDSLPACRDSTEFHNTRVHPAPSYVRTSARLPDKAFRGFSS